MLNDNNFFSGGGAADFYDHPIEQSLRFNDDDSAYLSWTPASAGNRKTWTWSGWVKRGNLGGFQKLFFVNTGSINTSLYFDSTNNTFVLYDSSTGATLITNSVYRDTSSWYHFVLTVDTTQATSSNRVKLYVNGEQVTSFSTGTYPAQNSEMAVNTTSQHELCGGGGIQYFDGYLAEVHFIDGTALDASSFGETKSGVWIPKAYSGSYGTNGFYLPFNHDYSVEGFSATTYTGNGGTQYIGGVGFEPDLVWIKNRDSAGENHSLYDSVRPEGYTLYPNLTEAENTGVLLNLENDGFSLTTGNNNASGSHYVAWCWDAGSGSPVSNTDGSITSTVKASTTYGFSIVSYTGDAGTTSTVGHGLSQAPEFVIFKNRSLAKNWIVFSDYAGNPANGDLLFLNSTSALLTGNSSGNVSFNASTIGLDYGDTINGSGNAMIAYCFHSVSGYSKIGSYTGTGASGNSVTTGFKPAFVMIKRTDSIGNWLMYDSARDVDGDNVYKDLGANTSSAEQLIGTGSNELKFTATGFESKGSESNLNASGGTYIYMAFADKREAAFWLDQSGNNNDFENNNLTESDISLDSPTNNFATLNPLVVGRSDGGGASWSAGEGNLKGANYNGSGGWAMMGTTYSIPEGSGKWYFECVVGSTGQSMSVGIQKENTPFAAPYIVGYTGDANGYSYANDGYKWNNGSTAYGSAASAGDIIGVAIDASGATTSITYYKNNTSMGTAFSGLTGSYMPALSSTSGSGNCTLNFGQDSSFAGNKVAQGNTDANGYGDFYYAPPTGYLALCTANLEVPDAMNPALDNSPQDYFNTVLYTGTGTAGLAITGVGFQPDWVWLKRRSAASNHHLFDAVRGVTKFIQSSTTDAEITTSYSLSSFDSDGFTLDATGAENPAENNSGDTYVSWNWKANGSGVSNTDGSITSTVSANTDAGFSIVSWASDGTDGKSVGHGLSEKPDMIIVKNRSYTDATQAWHVWHQALDSGSENGEGFLWLDNTNAETDYNYQYLASDSTLIYPQGNRRVRGNNGDNMIAYCFHSVSGFSKFGSYRGTNVAEGSFVYTGFKPAFVLIKNTGQAFPWIILDATRNSYNLADDYLQADSSAAEVSDASRAVDFLSNGFKLRGDSSYTNSSSYDMIYMAFSSNPFKYSTAR